MSDMSEGCSSRRVLLLMPQGDFEHAMQQRRNVSREEQEMAAMIDFMPWE